MVIDASRRSSRALRWLAQLGYAPPQSVVNSFLGYASRSYARPPDLRVDWQALFFQAQSLSPVAGYQRTENQFRRYERLARRPEQFLVLGDAVCAFNPIYRQGITVAALDAILLADCLHQQRRRHPEGDWTGLAEQFQRRLARSNVTPWLLVTGEDQRCPTAKGPLSGLPTRLFDHYLDRLIAASTENRRVSRVFLRVLHMLAPPTATLLGDEQRAP